MFSRTKPSDSPKPSPATGRHYAPPEPAIHQSVTTFAEDAGYQLGWAGMTDALIISQRCDDLAHDIRGDRTATRRQGD